MGRGAGRPGKCSLEAPKWPQELREGEFSEITVYMCRITYLCGI